MKLWPVLIWKKSEPKVFNWSEFHFFEVTSYKIHTLSGWFYFAPLTLLFWFYFFLEARAEILEKILLVFFEDLKTPKGHFKINWPLTLIDFFFNKRVVLYSHHCTVVHLVVTVDSYSVNSSEWHTLKSDALRYRHYHFTPLRTPGISELKSQIL